MNKENFWKLIASASKRGELDISRLGKRLERLPIESIIEFDSQLHDHISAIKVDSSLEALRENPQVEQPISDDGFEYLLAGVISRGRKVFEEARRDASLLRSGQWPENEDLLYIAGDVIEARNDSPQTVDSGREVIVSSARVFAERYPIPPIELEREFPVDSFGWILVDVQDAGHPAIEVLMHDEGSFTIYPESDSDFVRAAFQGPAVAACAKLRSNIDFRMIPGLVLNISITIGDQTYGPEIRPICSRNGPFDLRPGVAIGIGRHALPESNSPEFQRFGASVVFDALEEFFTGHAQELAYISHLRNP